MVFLGHKRYYARRSQASTESTAKLMVSDCRYGNAAATTVAVRKETAARIKRWVPPCLVAAAITFDSSCSHVAMPPIVNFDKVAHFAVFGFLGTLVYRAGRAKGNDPPHSDQAHGRDARATQNDGQTHGRDARATRNGGQDHGRDARATRNDGQAHGRDARATRIGWHGRLAHVWEILDAKGCWSKWPALLAVLIVSAFGVTDEWHQSFVPGRDCDVFDWLADTLGAALAVTLYVKWAWYRRLLEIRVGPQRQVEKLAETAPNLPA